MSEDRQTVLFPQENVKKSPFVNGRRVGKYHGGM